MTTSSLAGRWQWFAFAMLAARLTVPSCEAHPDLIEQIASIGQRMGDVSPSPALYLERADLYRRHGEFDAALADISAAERLQTNSTPLQLDRARVLSDAGRAAEALPIIQKFLASV